jgi:hypothetical protein
MNNLASSSSLLDAQHLKLICYTGYSQNRSNQRIELKELYSLVRDIDITTFTHENYTQIYDNIITLKQIYQSDKTKINYLLANLESTLNAHKIYPVLNNALHIIDSSIEICDDVFVELNRRLTTRSLESISRAIVLDHYYLQSLSANDRCIVENTVGLSEYTSFNEPYTESVKETHKYHVIYTGQNT